MKVLSSLLLSFALALFLQGTALADDDESDSVIMTLPEGDVVIELEAGAAPQHAERIRTLVSEGFYDGVVFHRVIDGFMAQSGDPTGTGTGGSSYPDLPAEFSDISFERGVVGMARSQNPNSANSQFFIMFAAAPHLNGQYTVVGRVISGMEAVDALKKGAANQNGMVSDPDRIIRAQLVEDD